MKRLELTQPMRDALEAVARAQRFYVPGRDSASIVELPKLALADAMLAAVRAQTDRLAKLPARAVTPVVEVSIRPKRRRRA